MNLRNRTSLDRIRTHMARVLSCVLLVGIVYSATFDAAHNHGIVSSKLAHNISHNLTGQADAVSEVPVRSRSEGQECLICVLHRQFSNNIVQTPFLIAVPFTHTAVISTSAVFQHSINLLSSPIARHSGRAPPYASS